MARPLRIEYAGAVYHVMARGNQGRPIFDDNKDRVCFLKTLGEACEKTGWRIHAYVLMGNHYHLLAETPEGNLVAGMKWLQGAYTQRYNSRHEVFGHLFQGRYKALVIDGNAPGYFEVVSTYIHLNPARAGLIRIGQEPLQEYEWSSYPWYLSGGGKDPAWLHKGRVLGALRIAPEEAFRYEKYIEARVLELELKTGRKELEEKWKALRRGWYMGEESFLEKLKKRLKGMATGKRSESHSGGAKRTHGEAAAEGRLAKGVAALGLGEEELMKLPKGAPEKVAVAWWLREGTTVSLRWVSERLEMGHYTRVTQAVSRASRNPGKNLERIKRKLVDLEKENG